MVIDGLVNGVPVKSARFGKGSIALSTHVAKNLDSGGQAICVVLASITKEAESRRQTVLEAEPGIVLEFPSVEELDKFIAYLQKVRKANQ